MKAWIIYSFSGSIVLSVMILLIKYIEKKISSEVILLFIMTIASICFAGHSFYTDKIKIVFNDCKLLFILFLCGILSYLGNFLWMQSLKLAPNAGYALAIFDARTIIVVLASYFLLNSELSIIQFFGIAVVFIGLRLITWN
jgi:drug/metabolite transporter (DMT)-like permease